MIAEYVALVIKTDFSGEYNFFFPAFPGLALSGSTVKEATQNAREGLIFHIEGLLKDNQEIPVGRTVKEIFKDPQYENIKFYEVIILEMHLRIRKSKLLSVEIRVKSI